jgi:hypothetical protein
VRAEDPDDVTDRFVVLREPLGDELATAGYLRLGEYGLHVVAGDIVDVSGALPQDGDRQLSTYASILASARRRRQPSG